MEFTAKKRALRACSNICIVKFCKTTSQTLGTNLFRFPKDEESCNRWVKKCGCEYLLRKISNLHTSYYRVCNLHFEERCFVRSSKNEQFIRLVPGSTPTLKLPGHSTTDSIIVNDLTQPECSQPQPSPEPSAILQLKKLSLEVSVLRTTNNLTGKPPTVLASLSRDMGTQTSKILMNNTPQKNKLRKKIRSLQKQCCILRKKLRLITRDSSIVTLEDFKQCYDKFLNPECASFVKLQAEHKHKSSQQKRFTKDS